MKTINTTCFPGLAKDWTRYVDLALHNLEHTKQMAVYLYSNYKLPIGVFTCQSNEACNKTLKRALGKCLNGSRTRDRSTNMYHMCLRVLADQTFVWHASNARHRKKMACTWCFDRWIKEKNRKAFLRKKRCKGCPKCVDVTVRLHTRGNSRMCPHYSKYKPRYRDSDWRVDDVYGSQGNPIFISDTTTTDEFDEDEDEDYDDDGEEEQDEDEDEDEGCMSV